MILPDEIRSSAFFRYLPAGNYEIRYAGCSVDGVNRFELEASGVKFTCVLMQTIAEAEEGFWLSIREIWTQAVKMSEASLFGSFELLLIATAPINAEHMLNISNLSALIVNHARKLKPGSAVFVSYSGYWFRLKSLAPLDWGKITFKTTLQVFRQEREKLDTLFKKALKSCEAWQPGSLIVVQDFGTDPLFRFGEEGQTDKLFRFFQKEKQRLSVLQGVYYLNQKRGDSELREQFSGEETA